MLDLQKVFALLSEYTNKHLKGAKLALATDFAPEHREHNCAANHIEFVLYFGISFHPFNLDKQEADGKLIWYFYPYCDATQIGGQKYTDTKRELGEPPPAFAMHKFEGRIMYDNNPFFESIAIHYQINDYANRRILNAFCGNHDLSFSYRSAPRWVLRQPDAKFDGKTSYQYFKIGDNAPRLVRFFGKNRLGEINSTTRQFADEVKAAKYYQKFLSDAYNSIKTNRDVFEYFPEFC